LARSALVGVFAGQAISRHSPANRGAQPSTAPSHDFAPPPSIPQWLLLDPCFLAKGSREQPLGGARRWVLSHRPSRMTLSAARQEGDGSTPRRRPLRRFSVTIGNLMEIDPCFTTTASGE
jgi:hypothetical protein